MRGTRSQAWKSCLSPRRRGAYCARRDDKGKFLLGFEYPEYEPFMSNSENEEARRRYDIGFRNRGTPANLDLLREATRLRRVIAGLHGLPSYAHFATRRRMVRN